MIMESKKIVWPAEKGFLLKVAKMDELKKRLPPHRVSQIHFIHSPYAYYVVMSEIKVKEGW